MHQIEPFYRWRDLYSAEDDPKSPFHGEHHSEFEYSQAVYNYYIHPQWDGFGSSTLYLKVLYANYEDGHAIIEFIGEWNDLIGNDIMFLKQNVIDKLARQGIRRFILIGENVLNFHGAEEDYYREWAEEVEEHEGYIMALNLREHILDEMRESGILDILKFNGVDQQFNWRNFEPADFCDAMDSLLLKRRLVGGL